MRVTIDVDNKLYFFRSFLALRQVTGQEPEIWVSASGRGFHLICSDLNITEQESIILRRLAGDDAIRIAIDEATEGYAKPKQVLWTEKNGNKARRIDKTEALDLIAIEFDRFTALEEEVLKEMK